MTNTTRPAEEDGGTARAAFEARFSAEPHGLRMERWSSRAALVGEYKSFQTQFAWEGYQAGRATAGVRIMDPVLAEAVTRIEAQAKWLRTGTLTQSVVGTTAEHLEAIVAHFATGAAAAAPDPAWAVNALEKIAALDAPINIVDVMDPTARKAVDIAMGALAARAAQAQGGA